MVEEGGGNFSFHNSDAWVAASVGTQKVTTEHITAKDKQKHICTDASVSLKTHYDLSGLTHLSPSSNLFLIPTISQKVLLIINKTTFYFFYPYSYLLFSFELFLISLCVNMCLTDLLYSTNFVSSCEKYPNFVK